MIHELKIKLQINPLCIMVVGASFYGPVFPHQTKRNKTGLMGRRDLNAAQSC